MSHHRHLALLVGTTLLSLAALTGCSTGAHNTSTSPSPARASASAPEHCTAEVGSKTVPTIPGDYHVTKVVDGDTLRVHQIKPDCSTGPEQTVRVLGINAPEIAHGTHGTDECGGESSLDFMQNKVANSYMVKLVPDHNSSKQDKYGRILAYVETVNAKHPDTPGTDIGAEMVKEGYAAPWAPAGVQAPERMGDYQAMWDQAKADQLGNIPACPLDQLEAHG